MADSEKAEVVARRRVIEDFVSENLLTEAFNALQDLCRDYAAELRPAVLALRNEYEDFVAARRAGQVTARTTLYFQKEILALSERIEAQSAVSGGQGGVDAKGVSVADRPVVVRCSNVSRRFAKGNFRLENLSVELREGEITGIVGRNASGKTTLLRLMMGDLFPDSGEVQFPLWTEAQANRRPDWVAIKKDIAYVPQLPGEWTGPLRQNLNYMVSATQQSLAQRRALIDWNVARYEMKRYEHATWNALSGGYKIRFELVRALVMQPKLLILDEPLAYLDVIARQRFLEDLRTIASSVVQPIPIVVTSQHLNEIEAVADQMILLNDGKCQFSGPVAGIGGLYGHKMIEIAVKATRHDVEAALTGVTIFAMERSLEGFILSLDRDEDSARVFSRLSAAFGDRFTTFNDISRSSRGLLSAEV